uniref:Intersectin 2b n=1 Tax=Scophthalmus maximus TaxID=52904 RepID=A0A8D3DPW3_SCOMX
GGPSVWAVSPEERVKHDQKFDTLSPSMGYVSGEQARKFFLQSGLPPSVLAEIWSLADMNKDGKMDRLEFSIAMKLIKLKLQGTPLPSALPIIMKQPPVPIPNLNNPTSSMISPAYGIVSMPNMSMMPRTNLAMLTPISMATPGLSPMTGLSPLVPTATGLSPLMVSTNTRPLMPTMGNATLPNGSMGILHPLTTGPLATGLPLSASAYSSPLGMSSSPAGINKASSLLDLGSISILFVLVVSLNAQPHNDSPEACCVFDWAVPHASRLKYRQQFNGLDKQMTGYLTGQQVRGAMSTTMLTQTQLASIWTLADVDKDGKLKAEEFILAMHLVDMAKSGQPLPLTLPTELVPPSQRYGAQRTHFNKKKKKEEWERRRRGELQIKKVQEQDDIIRLKAKKRSLEMELEAVGNKHRQISDRLRDIQNKKKLQKTELDLTNQRKETRQQDINNVHRQLEELQRKLSQLTPEQKRLTEKLRNMALNNMPVSSMSTLKVSVSEKKGTCMKMREQLNALEKETAAKLTEMDRYNKDMMVDNPHETKQKNVHYNLIYKLLQYLQCLLPTLRRIKMEKERQWQEKLRRDEEERQRRLQEEREAKQREEEEKEKQALIRSAKEQAERELRAKEEAERKRREEERRKREEEEKKKREEDERQRLVERRRQEEERRKLEEERRLLEEERRKLEEERKREEKRKKEDEERKKLEEERREGERRREKEEEERRRQRAAEAAVRDAEERRKREEEERRKKEEEDRRKRDEERRRRKAEEERKRKEEASRQQQQPSGGGKLDIQEKLTSLLRGLEERKGGQPRATHHRKSAALTSFKVLYPFTARNNEELSLNADDIIEVDETTEREEGWLCGSKQGKMGWFPESYVERVALSKTSNNTVVAPPPPAAAAAAIFAHVSFSSPEYEALYTYESPEPGDLTFSEGDVILVSKRDGEWWNGSIGDRTGLFPSNYVKPKETDTSSTSGKKKPEIGQVIRAHSSTGPAQLNLENGQLILVLGKNASGWWIGELQARGKKRQKGWFPASHVKILGSNSGKSTPAPLPVCLVIAVYDYSAANKDEMSFSKGQLINVLDKNNPDWWKGEINGVTGLFPTNYVKMTTVECDPSQQWCADLNSLDSLSPQEKKRQGYIHELIQTEERYVEDLNIVLEVFHRPMSESGRLNEAEMSMIFVNWKELLACNTKLLKALRVRKKTGGDNMPVQMIGDILAAELSHMQPYIRFCSCQINGATLLQNRTDNEPDFKNFLKKIATDYRCKGMPLSSFLLKPMQRITRYPLHMKNILECTAEGHADCDPLREALEKAEELCQQVNEGVREKENSDRLEWIQSHVQCDGVVENLVFNSLTNCLGPRKLLHSGKMHKAKSNKELWAFLFNDFLLLTYAAKQFTTSGPDKLFSTRTNAQLKMYKPPVLLNEVLVKLPDPSSDEPLFHISHIDRVYILRTDNINERTAWVQKIKAASEEFIETEKRKREKAYQARSVKSSGIGRLLVTILEATELKAGKPNGKSNPYCEVTMGAQIFTSRTLNDTLNPKWNFNCQFHIRDIYQDVLCITIFERDQFSPDDFLGRTEVPVATIRKELENKGPVTRRLLLHEVPTGEVWVRLDLQLFSGK